MLNKKRLKTSYPRDIREATHLLAFNPAKILYYGSQAKKSMYLSSGDIDLIEPIDQADAYDVAKKLSRIVKEIQHTEDCYLGDVKSGIDPRYSIDIGDISHGKIHGFNANTVHGLVASRDYPEKEKMLELLKGTMTIPKWFELNDMIRKKEVLRWTADEIHRGYKEVEGQKFYLHETAKDPNAMTKIDMIQYLQSLNRYVEITNYFFVDGKKDEYENVAYLNELKHSILQCYVGEKYFKLTKRLMSYCLMSNHKHEAEKLYGIVHSGIGILYQIVSELKAIEYILEHYNPPIDKLKDQLDAIRYKIGNVYEIEFKESDIDAMLDVAMKTTSHDGLLENIKKICERLDGIVNKVAKRKLHEIKLVPLPKRFYP
jgi:hypothetical protein